jgi:SAM-dependent methyltransferase
VNGRTPLGEQYYAAYEQRYQAVYAQGVRHWTAFPSELEEIRSDVSPFLSGTGLPSNSRLIEFGCGEGYVGELVVAHGFRYTGMDLAESALDRARERLPDDGDVATVIHGDITNLSGIRSASFDAGVDVGCLHMLLIDSDRRRYLNEAHRILVKGAPMLIKDALSTDPRCDEPVGTVDTWLDRFAIDVVTKERREAWSDDGSVAVDLSLLPARPRTLDGYREELTSAGFTVEQHNVSDDSMRVTIIARAV